jgi:hypothetical protein
MPSWRDLKRYCERDDWELYKQTDHFHFRKRLENGDVLYTEVSMGSGQIGGRLWSEILRKQLRTTQEQFNRTV